MAAARVMMSASSISTSSSTIFKVAATPLLKPNRLRPCFNTHNKLVSSKRFFTCRALYKPHVQITEEGLPETLDYRVFFVDDSGKKISPWHDIPLHLGDGAFNFIVEIPKNQVQKWRYNINWNYGLLPQTWEDPSFANPDVDGAFGDNDSVDVVEIGENRGKVGQLMKVKPLGCLAMIDEGELDWKIVAISLDDPRAPLVNDVDDVDKHFPGTLMAIRDWFRDYKIPDGKPANKFGLGNKVANKKFSEFTRYQSRQLP
ncbi:hypothetical protein L1887_24714 [Cichorium endivia]|nr:hypothetical protein L1887_24714 [Cichorium endivia]